MRRSKRFQEKALGCLSISCGTKKKFQGVSLGIDGAIQIHPRLFHFHIRLIDAPRVVRRFEMRSASFLQFRCVVLDPAIDRRVIDMQSSLCHHLLQISVAKRIPEVPAYTEQNNLGLKVTPFERVGGVHAIVSSQFSEYRRAYYILAVFATQPRQRPSIGEKVGSTLSSHTRKTIQIIAIQLPQGNLGEQVGSMPWSALDLKPATQVTDTFLHRV